MDRLALASHRKVTRALAAEALGTGLLIIAVISSGVMASQLSPADVGLQLLENAAATAGALVGLILMFGAVSGAHFNPVVTITDRLLGTTTNGMPIGPPSHRPDPKSALSPAEDPTVATMLDELDSTGRPFTEACQWLLVGNIGQSVPGTTGWHAVRPAAACISFTH